MRAFIITLCIILSSKLCLAEDKPKLHTILSYKLSEAQLSTSQKSALIKLTTSIKDKNKSILIEVFPPHPYKHPVQARILAIKKGIEVRKYLTTHRVGIEKINLQIREADINNNNLIKIYEIVK
jgi:hypothetical protein